MAQSKKENEAQKSNAASLNEDRSTSNFANFMQNEAEKQKQNRVQKSVNWINIEYDEQGNIKGWADKVAALKTQNPKYFADNSGGSYQGFRPMDKENPPAPAGKTKADILKMPYADRVKFFNENPDAYHEIMKG